MLFEVADVHEVLDLLSEARVDAVVLGGWGVDALAGEQSRPHNDLDLWVSERDDASLRRVLGAAGYSEVEGGRAANYVLRDGRKREIDVHLVSYGTDGTATYEIENGGEFVMLPGVFTEGRIGGRVVRCVSAEQQMLDHSDGYEPGVTDRADMALLHERLGVEYLPPFGDG